MYRAEGSKIGAGEVRHTGVIPFWKTHLASVKSCSQGGIRGGAATLYYPIWHLEVENLLVLKNNKGVDENRIRHLDYGVQINDLMIERLIKNDYITLFSPSEEMYSAYFEDSIKFKEIYEANEKNHAVRKKRVKALELFESFFTERSGTARIYPFFVDNVNKFGPFIREKAHIKQSNLCLSGESVVEIKINGEQKSVTMKELNSLRGDILVKSYDTSLDKVVWNKVTASALMNKNAKVLKITTPSGKSVICTPDHKIYTETSGWIEAKDLIESDILVEV